MELNRPKPVDCEHYEQGYYAGFRDNKGYIILSYVWVQPKVARRVGRNLSKISNQFALQSQRETVASVVDDLYEGDPPVGENRRYDPYNTYIIISKGQFYRIINNMVAAASWKQRLLEKELASTIGNLTPPKNETDVSKWSYDDAANSFHKNLTDYLLLINSETYLYDQYRFEKEFNMIWCCGPEKCLKPKPCSDVCKPPTFPPKTPNEPIPTPVTRTGKDLKAAFNKTSRDPKDYHIHFENLDHPVCRSDIHSKVTVDKIADSFGLPVERVLLFTEANEEDCKTENQIEIVTYNTVNDDIEVDTYDVER